MSYDPEWEGRNPPLLDLRKLILESGHTAVYPGAGTGSGLALLYLGAALAGEAGETSNQLKKVLRDDNDRLTIDRRERIKKELGGVMWYWLRACYETGLDPYEVIAANFNELRKREVSGTLRGDDTENGRVSQPWSHHSARITVVEKEPGLLGERTVVRGVYHDDAFPTLDEAGVLGRVQAYFSEWYGLCLGTRCREPGRPFAAWRVFGDTEQEALSLLREHLSAVHVKPDPVVQEGP